ncbi:MAG TPA: hypothetical protein VMU39_10545 [Solirubrobacteraceae bacterium]|nr:hypothetical protein [Solirubrobacteraceae bacterium]
MNGSCHAGEIPGTGLATAACPMNAGSVGAGPVFSIGTAGPVAAKAVAGSSAIVAATARHVASVVGSRFRVRTLAEAGR